VQVKVTVEGSNIICDLTGSDANVETGFNCPFDGSTVPGIYTIMRSVFLDEATHDEDFVPQNDGIFRPITVIAPEGSLFNPSFPRSAIARVCPILTAADSTMRALAEVVPDKISAGTSTVTAVVYSGFDEASQEYWMHFEVIEGSYGGRATKDGLDAVDTLITNSRNVPIEEVEMLFPIRTERYELRSDPPAPGQFRGGIASVRENLFLEDCVMASEADGTYEAPWGIFGGHDGLPMRITKIGADGSEQALYSKTTGFPMEKGSRVRWEQASGGGYGKPLERDPARVLRDVQDEYITAEMALRDYGVVIDAATLTVNEAATEGVRAERAGTLQAAETPPKLAPQPAAHPTTPGPSAERPARDRANLDVACLQLRPPSSDLTLDAHVAAVVQELEELAPVDLVVLPELWATGYFRFDRYASVAQTRNGVIVTALAAAAQRLGAYVVGGSFVERADSGALQNTSFVVDPAGDVIGWYPKTHVFGYGSREAELIEPGSGPVTVQTELGRLGVAICYDLRFPELFRALVDQRADLIVVPAAWPMERVEDWRLLTRVRALENQVFVVACNGAGRDAGVELGGHTTIIDPRGTALIEADDRPGTVRATIDMGDVETWRATFPALADRHPEGVPAAHV
jgi:predicted amidohydrolase